MIGPQDGVYLLIGHAVFEPVEVLLARGGSSASRPSMATQATSGPAIRNSRFLDMDMAPIVTALYWECKENVFTKP